MKFTYAEISITGPVRDNNEDNCGWYRYEALEAERTLGAAILIADGVGGHGKGELASHLAVKTALEQFKSAKQGATPRSILNKMFDAANLAVYDEGMQDRREGRMATTLTIALLRNNEVTIGHIGDCRSYLIRGGEIRRITTDHSYVGMQLKMGLITEREAMASDLRSMLTRTVGQHMTIGPDFHTVSVFANDYLVQCSDGLHGWVTEAEICEAAILYSPEDACNFLIGLAEKRNSEDNITIQITKIEQVEHVGYWRGTPFYVTPPAPKPSNEVETGQLLDARFQITDVLARTATHSIFKATDLETNTTVAVKVPLEHHRDDPLVAIQLDREEQIGAAMAHPGILKIIPVTKRSRPYLVMEYLEGQTLAKLLLSVKPLPVNDAVKIASRLCDALDYMHRRRMNVIHRDLKPENIMICNDGTLRIIDFGIAKATGNRSVKFKGYTPALGTPDYLAPEQVQGKPGDEQTDVYSMGVILYEMVTGKVPFDGPNVYAVMNARVEHDPVAPRRLNSQIPAAIEEIILHAMERDSVRRFDSAAEMKDALDAPEKVELTGRCGRLKTMKWAPAKRGMLSLTVVIVLLPVAIILIFFLLFHRPSH